MIKILINEEEVVSNSNLQITEEMLSTSSTILKNCYPKSWELDKDYASRYYFPKDYSKCEIYDLEDIEFEIKGSTSQSGTPTPTSQKAITSKTGTITETIDGVEYTFDLGNISLNKIGTYEDRIYKDNGKWYIEYKTRRINNIKGGFSAFPDASHVFKYNQTEKYPKYASKTSLYSYGRCTRFRTGASYNTITATASGFNGYMCCIMAGYTNGTLLLKHTSYSTAASFNSWLSSNPIDIVYVLQTPYIEEITDSHLLEQLNSVKKGNLIFCGVVKNTGNISLNPREPHYVDLQVLDFKTMLSEGETLNYVISNKTITEAIQQVIDSIADYGFVLGNINIQNPSEIIGAYSTLDKTAYDVFQYIAEITQSRWTTRMVDEDTVAIDFFDPLLVGINKTIESTEQYYCDNDIVDISFNYSTNDYRNKQIMTSEAVMGSIVQSENKLGDGYTKTFVLENKIGSFSSITINGEAQSVITKAQQELGYTGDFVFEPGENIVSSFNIIPAGSTIIFDYFPVVRGREIIVNPTEISRIATQTNRNGEITRYENRNDTTSSLELAKIGQSYIKYKGTAEIKLKVIATKDLFNVGEIVNYDSLVNDLDKNYMVKTKTIDMYLNADKIFYTYELTSNFNSENAINYFDNQRAKLNGNLGEGETIIRDIDFENTANIIFYETEIEEIEAGTTALDFMLDGMLV